MPSVVEVRREGMFCTCRDVHQVTASSIWLYLFQRKLSSCRMRSQFRGRASSGSVCSSTGDDYNMYVSHVCNKNKTQPSHIVISFVLVFCCDAPLTLQFVPILLMFRACGFRYDKFPIKVAEEEQFSSLNQQR